MSALMNSVIDSASSFYHEWSQGIIVLLVIIAVLLINRVLHWLMAALVRHISANSQPWRHAILSTLDVPLRNLVWVIGATIVVSLLNAESDWPALDTLFPPIRDVLAIVIVTWFLIQLLDRIEKNLTHRAASRGEVLDPTAVDAIRKVSLVIILISAALVMMQTLGFSITGLLAFGGAAGIAVGFASQSLVANLLGGLTVFATRIFKIGDYIILPGTELMGGVEHIGWRATRVIGFDRKPFYVPNATFNTSVVINHSRMTNRRVMEYVHLRYQDIDKVDAIVSDTNTMIASHEGIDQNFFVFRFDSYGDYALKLFLYAFTNTTDYGEYMRIKEEILLRIANIIRHHGGELALPTSNIHLPDGLRLAAPLDPALAGQ